MAELAVKDSELELEIDQELLSLEVETGDEFILAGKVVHALVSLIKAHRCYAPNNTLLKAQRLKFHALISAYLDRFYAMALQVGETSFSMQGQEVYACPDVKSSIPFLFFRDGIRELRFLMGIEESEVNGLMQVVRQGDSVNYMEDDLVTLLWEKEFLHIHFLAADSYLDDVGKVTVETVEDFQTRRETALSTTQLQDAEVEELGIEDSLPSLLADKALYRLGREELQALQREVLAETSVLATMNSITLLFDMLPLAVKPEVYAAELEHLRKLLDELFDAGEYQQAARVLQRLGGLLSARQLNDWQQPGIQQILATISDRQWAELLRAHHAKKSTENVNALANLIMLRPARTLPVVMQMHDQAGQGATRRLLEAALQATARANIDALLCFLEGSSSSHTRLFASMLGEVGDRRAVPFLGKVMGNSDPSVRIAVIAALAKIGEEAAYHVIASAVDDPDEMVRCRAAYQLGQHGCEVGMAALLPTVTSRAFRQRSAEEIRIFLKAVAQCRRPLAYKTLRQLMWAHDLVNRQGAAVIRRQARHMLAQLDQDGVLKPCRPGLGMLVERVLVLMGNLRSERAQSEVANE